jgi:dTDP-4-amino-4,6-dideoxygalactose transaminase
MQNFGFEDYDRVASVGTNGKMAEISAAMGLTGLESLNDFISVNVQHYREYDEQLSGIPGIDLVRYDGSGTSNYQYVVVEIDEPEAGLSRDMLVDILWAEGAYVRRYFYPGCHRMEPYRSLYPDAGLRLPETERMVERLLCLPTGTGIDASEIRKICEILRMVVWEAPEVNRKLTPKTPVPTFESVSV